MIYLHLWFSPKVRVHVLKFVFLAACICRYKYACVTQEQLSQTVAILRAYIGFSSSDSLEMQFATWPVASRALINIYHTVKCKHHLHRDKPFDPSFVQL